MKKLKKVFVLAICAAIMMALALPATAAEEVEPQSGEARVAIRPCLMCYSNNTRYGGLVKEYVFSEYVDDTSKVDVYYYWQTYDCYDCGKTSYYYDRTVYVPSK